MAPVGRVGPGREHGLSQGPYEPVPADFERAAVLVDLHVRLVPAAAHHYVSRCAAHLPEPHLHRGSRGEVKISTASLLLLRD